MVCTIPPGIRQRSVLAAARIYRIFLQQVTARPDPGFVSSPAAAFHGQPCAGRRFVRISASSLRHGPAPTPRASKPTPSMRTLVLPWPARKALPARRQARVDLEQALLRANGSLPRYPPPSKCHSRILPTQCRRFQERIEA
ncbi:hypothetical protein HDE78_000256 [Rhodanobacter sp. K2T2]|nr:hypothetical protein [Rhodanobacter sp. K2T2]